MKKLTTWLLPVVFSVLPFQAFAADADEIDLRQRLITTVISEAVPTATVVAVRESELKGLYEVELESGIVYATADGKYILQGDLLNVNGKLIRNVTDLSLAKKRVKDLATFPVKNMIVYSPRFKTKKTVTIFTDVDCGYCRKQHQELDALLSAGIAVRYIPYPRSGVEGATASKMANVWCAKDRKKAITDAKSDGPLVESKSDCTSIMKEGYALGRRLGVTGTPAIYDDTGKQLGGYLTAEQLKKALGL